MTDITRDTRGRFPPGQSGNRNGRPRKPKTVSQAIITANKTVPASENGRKRRMRKLDATATQFANKGASGDFRSGKLLLEMAARVEPQEASQAVPETLTISDEEILDDFLAQYRKHLEEEGNNEAATYEQFDAITRLHLAVFLRRVFAELNPGAEYLDNFHIHVLIDELEALRFGHQRRLAIAMPPRSLKSQLISVAFGDCADRRSSHLSNALRHGPRRATRG